MRKTLLLFLIICSKLVSAQLIDDFSDGDFTSSPKWSGTVNYFRVSNGYLQSNGPQASSTLYLSTSNTLAAAAVWEFYLKLSFDPSTTNYPRIYLVSNKEDLSSTSDMQAYYLQLGSPSNAENFFLVKQNGTTSTTLLNLPDKPRSNANAVTVRVRVERDLNGHWDIYTDFTGGRNFTFDGSVIDNTFISTSYFGVYCRYSTGNRFNQFYFTDFKIESYVAAPPQLLEVKSLDDQTFEVTFDKAVNASALQSSNYGLSGLGSPQKAEAGINPAKIKLSYADAVPSGNYTLTVSHIADLRNNVMPVPQVKSFLHIKKYIAKKGDVIINEIMANPKGVKGLPETEYIELWNKSDEYIIVSGWKYSKDAATKPVVLTADTLAPKQYLILCANANAPLLKPFGKAMGLASWPALTNTKANLKIYDMHDNLIDEVSYTDTWYQDAKKKSGGFSLELINPYGNCTGGANWIASIAEYGGTPGSKNSVYNDEKDTQGPQIILTTIINPRVIQIDFDKKLAAHTAINISNYVMNNGVGTPVSIELVEPLYKTVMLTFEKDLTKGIEYTLTCSNLTNCSGAEMQQGRNASKFFYAKDILPNSILISEVLFNPKVRGAEFVEIYNNTEHILDLKDLKIGNADRKNDKIISNVSLFIQPKTYWVLSANIEHLKETYSVKYPDQMVKMPNMPAYNNDKGMVALYVDDKIIDSFSYHEKMHHALLKNYKGVSLERVSFNRHTNESTNWQSAAVIAGYATPTSENSQQENGILKNEVVLVSKTFSPDQDGFEDTLQINYRFKQNGNLATINIYTDKGLLVRNLIRNNSMPTQGSLEWDGLDNNGKLCKVGVYVIKFETFTAEGEVERFTKTCVLAAKLN
ncbi:lamin tail domain-containing protein [Pedobacter montanisoli]|uniref:Lamin tail domain-containing protein n=1 Tax=Pedobacter montanisoli TaxID=2923277 RepID=A0ABS9ZTA4_9SPHI|nr:lamin tail domain-containing protein [Pedobacter montanisoli]MCJ0741174.1 lamin tail domain-containing protein [Pedobacter montanisoli]